MDAVLLRNFLRDNPVVDYLQKHGKRHGLHPDAHAHAQPISAATHVHSRFETWIREKYAPSAIVDAQYDRQRTLDALAQQCTVVLNPLLEARGFVARPHAVIDRDALRTMHSCSDADGAPRYVSVECTGARIPGKPITLGNNIHNRLTNAKCHIAAIALRDALQLQPEVCEQPAPRKHNKRKRTPEDDEPGTRDLNHIMGVALGRNSIPNLATGAWSNVAVIRHRAAIMELCEQAKQWVLDLRAHGHTWDILTPHRWELTPNMRADCLKWTSVLQRLAQTTGEMTLLYYCGQAMKRRAFLCGKRSYHDLHETPGLTPLQAKIVWSNHRDNPSAAVQPRSLGVRKHVHLMRECEERPWFTTDFETIADAQLGQHWVFMIASALHLPGDGRIITHHVALRNLTQDEQDSMVREWLGWLSAQARRCGYELAALPLLHWSDAEPGFLRKLRRQRRTPFEPNIEQQLDDLRWVDALPIFKNEPVIVPGAFDFKLKSVANALHARGEITTRWEDGVCNGYEATVLAKQLYDTRRTRQEHEARFDEIRRYNEIDTRVLLEIVLFLQRLARA